MRKSTLFTLIISLLSFVSCNQNQNSNKQAKLPENDDALERQCFKAISAKDTAFLKINNLEGKITGKLSFNFSEKNDTDGDISGEFKGDTLIVNYIYKSGGKVFSNPFAFLKKDNKFYQGYGEIETYLGKSYFKKSTPISYEQGFVFEPAECK